MIVRNDVECVAREVCAILIPAVAQTGETMTYGTLSKLIKEGFGHEVNPKYGFSRPLEMLQMACWDKGLPCLSAMVVRGRRPRIPGKGFFDCYREVYKPKSSMTDEDILRSEQKRCQGWRDWVNPF